MCTVHMTGWEGVFARLILLSSLPFAPQRTQAHILKGRRLGSSTLSKKPGYLFPAGCFYPSIHPRCCFSRSFAIDTDDIPEGSDKELGGMRELTSIHPFALVVPVLYIRADRMPRGRAKKQD